MARYLDEMATMVTGLVIHSSENHYNKHRNKYEGITSFRFGGGNESEKQQRNSRDPNHPDNTCFGGQNESEKQR